MTLDPTPIHPPSCPLLPPCPWMRLPCHLPSTSTKLLHQTQTPRPHNRHHIQNTQHNNNNKHNIRHTSNTNTTAPTAAIPRPTHGQCTMAIRPSQPIKCAP